MANGWKNDDNGVTAAELEALQNGTPITFGGTGADGAFTSSAPTTTAHGVNLSTTSSQTIAAGAKVSMPNVTAKTLLISVTKHANCTATTCRLRAALAGADMATASFVGNVATFNIESDIHTGAAYLFILCDRGGSAYTRAAGALAMPTGIWQSGLIVGSAESTTTIYNIASIQTADETTHGIQGIHNYTTFTVSAGHCVFIGNTTTSYGIIKCTGAVSISGVVCSGASYAVGSTSAHGIGIYGISPFALSDSGAGPQQGGSGLGRGYTGQQAAGCGFGGNVPIGLDIIKKMRGWFTGCQGSGSTSGTSGKGVGSCAILFECMSTFTCSGKILANGGGFIDPPIQAGGGGCIGILSVGNINLTGATVQANGGNGATYNGGGGAFVAITEGTYTAPTSLSTATGTGAGGAGEAGASSTTSAAAAVFCRKSWALG